MVVLGGAAVSYERGTPARLSLTTFQPEADKGTAWQKESSLLTTYWNSLYHLDDFSRPALRHESLNSIFHEA